MSDVQAQEVVTRLRQLGKTREQKDWDALRPEVRDLVRNNPFALLVAVCFDRGMKWTRAWQIPWELEKRGLLQSERLSRISLEELTEILDGLPIRPRYGTQKGAETLSDAAELVQRQYKGDAGAIWRERSPAEVAFDLMRIRGVGSGIAQMTCRILHDDFGCFQGYERQIDIKPDRHVLRVFRRCGLIPSESAEMAVAAARRLSPEFPGVIDWGAWYIGTEWCRPKQPNCSSCHLGGC